MCQMLKLRNAEKNDTHLSYEAHRMCSLVCYADAVLVFLVSAWPNLDLPSHADQSIRQDRARVDGKSAGKKFQPACQLVALSGTASSRKEGGASIT